MHTALVLDVDGVVCPTSAPSPFGDLVEVGMALQPIRVSPVLCAALTALARRPGVTPVWLTSWLPATLRAMRAPFPGHDWEQIDLDVVRDGWPKWPALLAWLARNPSVGRVAWVDDDLSGNAAPDCVLALARRGIEALLLAPVAEHGLGRDDLARLERWLGGSPPP